MEEKKGRQRSDGDGACFGTGDERVKWTATDRMGQDKQENRTKYEIVPL